MTILITNILNYPEYKELVADWLMSYWGKNYPNRSKSDWIKYIGENMENPPMTLIAVDSSQDPTKPVGTVSLRFNGMPNSASNTIWLSALYVIPEYRNKGIGTALTKEIIKISSKRYEKLYLYTRTNGKIYQKMGWVTIKEGPIQDPHIRIMSKTLVPYLNLHTIMRSSQYKATTSLTEANTTIVLGKSSK